MTTYNEVADATAQAFKDQAELKSLYEHLQRNYPIILGLLCIELTFVQEKFLEEQKANIDPPKT